MPTNDYSKNIVYLSKEQYQELITNETLTVNGQTITYNDNDIYVTPQAEPITDVKINDTSISSNGIANIPIASANNLGVVKFNPGQGIIRASDNSIAVNAASDTNYKYGNDTLKPTTTANQHKAVFYGLAKAAGHDEKDSTESLGTYTPGAKQAIQNMLGITDLLSTEESSTATAAHALNSTFMMDGKLHRATAAIAIGDAVEVGVNCEVVKADEVFVKKTDYATNAMPGVVKVNPAYGTQMFGDVIASSPCNDNYIKKGTHAYNPLVSAKQHMSVFYGLSKVAGVDLKDEEVTLGIYPETSKTAIRSLIGAAAASDIPSVPVQDVQVNGTSVVSNGVANIPIATSSTPGVSIPNAYYGIDIVPSGNDKDMLRIQRATEPQIKAGTNLYKPIVPVYQHESVFYGLTKAAGVDMASSSNAVGTYTESAKIAIRSMLGATSSNVIAVQDEQPTNTDTKIWLPETEPTGIEVPTYAEHQALASTVAGLPTDIQIKGTSIINNNVANIPVAGSNILGVVKSSSVETVDGIMVSVNDVICISPADTIHIKSGTYSRKPICTSKQHEAVFYGLAKAAGDTTQSISTNAVGTYTDDAKAAIQTMLGVPGDIQVEGTSIVVNGVANLQKANASTYGLVKCAETVGAANGIVCTSLGYLAVASADVSSCKAGATAYRPISPNMQDAATFYGLAKAAGANMASSSNAVGTYTAEAKAAIHTMLGIDPASIAAQVDIPLVETISGTTPTITGQPNVRYVCGEVSTITITPPASGSVDVIFESGSTATTMTVPSTVKWPAWFDAEALEANTTYEVLITDGIYGSVMTWAT